MNPKSRPSKANSEQFLFNYVSSKTPRKKEKPYFGVIYAQREFFQKTLAKYNCSGPPTFKCQRYRVDWPSNQKLLHHYQHAKIILPICSIHQITCEIHLI